MKVQPILSINIPTFNRLGYLKEALAALLPQVSDEVEINVTDNHSTDGTWEYLGGLGGKVNRVRPPAPVNGNYNILSCVSLGTGLYTWIHCDDDVARLNAAENIVQAIKSFDSPPVLTFQWAGVDAGLPGFVNDSVIARWKRCDRNEFLRMVSYQFTFASAIIIKRGCADIDYIKSHAPLHLIPANIIFSTVGKYNDALVSEERLLTARGGSTDGHRLPIFSKETWELFEMNSSLGYDPEVLEQVYVDSIDTVLADAVLNYGVSWSGAWDVTRYSFRYKKFYVHLLPLLAQRLLPSGIINSLRLLGEGLAICGKAPRWSVRKLRGLAGPLSAKS